MKKISKMILVAAPAFVLAAAVGMTASGCGDDTTSTSGSIDMAVKVTTGDDLAVKTTNHDMATKPTHD